jgi:outer membrane protein assembly factor BamB
VAPSLPSTPSTLYTFSLAKAEAAFVEGTPNNFALAGTPVSASGPTYLRIYPENPGHLSLFTPLGTSASQADGSFSVQLSTTAAARPGSYTGKIIVLACVDSACAQPKSSGPMSIPYAITIYPRGLERYAAYDRPLLPLAGAAAWTTFQGNAGHTGFVPVTLDPAKFAARYRYTAKTAAGVELPMSEIANGAGTLYFSTGGACCGAPEYKTHALNEATAFPQWEYAHTNPLAPAAQAPAIAGDQIYVIGGANGSTTLAALSAAGGIRIRELVGGDLTGYSPAPTPFDGVVYAPTINQVSAVTAVDVANGTYLYTKGSGVAAAGWTPAVDKDYYYQYVDNYLYAAHRQTGLAAFAIAGPASAAQGYKPLVAPLIAAPNIVVGIDERTVAVFDTASKSLRWSQAGRFSRGAASDGTNLYIINGAGLSMEVRSLSDGSLAWSWQSVDFFTDYTSEPLVTNNLVFVSTMHATYAIDRTTHATVWTYPASGTLSLSPSGTLFIKGPTKVVAIALQ